MYEELQNAITDYGDMIGIYDLLGESGIHNMLSYDESLEMQPRVSGALHLAD